MTTIWRPRRKKQRNRASPEANRPTLRFSPYAWAKLIRLRDLGPTEIGGFGVGAPDDPLRIEDVRLVRQVCTAWSVKFVDEAVADWFDEAVDRGLAPERFARVWIHTHPGDSPRPSSVDEETFERVFGKTDWSVMAILAREGATYARLRFGVGPGAALELPVEVDFGGPFAGTDLAAWEAEHAACVDAEAVSPRRRTLGFDRLALFREGDPFGESSTRSGEEAHLERS